MAWGIPVGAKNYYVSAEIGNCSPGATVKVDERDYRVGSTAFSTIDGLIDYGIEENSTVYFGEGTYGSFTIDTPDVTLCGLNHDRDCRTSVRLEQESVITGTITVGASGICINGFRFSGEGCVRNDDATASSPIDDISFIYNKCEQTALTQSGYTAILYLGNAYRPASAEADQRDPTCAEAYCRYRNVTVAHNSFYGNAAERQPMFVQIAGSEGTAIYDNEFFDGGTSLSLFNTCGETSIEHNRFQDVGKDLRASGNATGEFCIRLFYIGLRTDVSPTDCRICHNKFDNCQGQSSMYALIRLYCGDSNETYYSPVNTNIYCNYNSFSNKNCYRTDGYNYVFYANNNITTTANVDWRFNRYDNSELQFAWIKPAWEAKAGRYYGSSSERFDFSPAASEVGYFGEKDSAGKVKFGISTPTGNADGFKRVVVGSQSLTKIPMHPVVQSMDIDDQTGDIYLIQECNITNTSGRRIAAAFPEIEWSNAMLFMTRIAKGGAQTHMYLSYGGHGSNMAVTRQNGQVYIVTGGVGSLSSTTPTQICIFPWVDGKALDLRSDPSVRYLNKNYGHTTPYPAVDNDNRLLMVRSRTSAGDYFTVYDLDRTMENPENAEYMKQIFAPANSKKISDASRQFLNDADRGFKTWSDQGFTISGNYIYTYEGDGKGGYGSNPVPTDKLAVLIINTLNWRTGEFLSRTPILRTSLLDDMCQGDDSGEPESLKIHRDANGRAYMAIGIVTGLGGNYLNPREYNCFAFNLNRAEGQGLRWELPANSIRPITSKVTMNSYESGSSANVVIRKSSELDGMHAMVSGEDADCFSIAHTSGSILDETHSFTLNFLPDRRKQSYNAQIRVSAPGAADAILPVSVKYLGDITTGIADEEYQQIYRNSGIPSIYDLNGRRLENLQPGVNILRYPNGETRKILK